MNSGEMWLPTSPAHPQSHCQSESSSLRNILCVLPGLGSQALGSLQCLVYAVSVISLLILLLQDSDLPKLVSASGYIGSV